MKLTIISDTHNDHNKLNMIKGDVLIHCGDMTTIWNEEKFPHVQLIELNEWFGTLDFKKIICIAGNHDRIMQDVSATRMIFTNAVYLEDETLEYEGVKFYGSPWQLECGNLGFNASEDELEGIWERIPDDTDVLITHSPPFGILDETSHGDMIGSVTLANKVEKIQPKIHCFGHCHAGNGNEIIDGVHYVNAASAISYTKFAEPFEIEI